MKLSTKAISAVLLITAGTTVGVKKGLDASLAYSREQQTKDQNEAFLATKLNNVATTDSFFKTADRDRIKCLGGDTLHLNAVSPTQVKCNDGRLLTYLPLDGTKITEYKGKIEEITMDSVAKLSKILKK